MGRLSELISSDDALPTPGDGVFETYPAWARRLLVNCNEDKFTLLKLLRRNKHRKGSYAAKLSGALVGSDCIQAQLQTLESDVPFASGGYGSGCLIRGDVLLVSERRAVGSIFQVGEVHLYTRPSAGEDFVRQTGTHQNTQINAGYWGEGICGNRDLTVWAAGAPNESGGTGSVEIWTRSGTTLTFDEKITPNHAQGTAYFGVELGMYGGDHLLVGSYTYDDGADTDAGNVEYWENVAGTWTYRSSFVRNAAFTAGQRFGRGIAMTSDSECFVHSTTGSTTESLVERWTRSGTTWTYQDSFTVPFGTGSISTSKCQMDTDGTVLVFGAHRHDAVSNNEGLILITDLNGTELASIEGDTLETELGYGCSYDNGYVAAGAWLADPSATANAGEVEVWKVCT